MPYPEVWCPLNVMMRELTSEAKDDGATPRLNDPPRVPDSNTPTLLIDASSFITHKQKLMGNVVVGNLEGREVLELDVLGLPRSCPAVRAAEAEWRSLLLALEVTRKQRKYRGPLQILTDAQSNLHAWNNGKGSVFQLKPPRPSWCVNVDILWVPRRQIVPADHALRFWMALLRQAIWGGSLPPMARAFGLESLPRGEAMRFRLSLRGTEARLRFEKGDEALPNDLAVRMPHEDLPNGMGIAPRASVPREPEQDPLLLPGDPRSNSGDAV